MSDDMAELLPEGGLHVVYRIGDTVRRPAHPWTPRVHQLLRHLTEAGFDASPNVYGYDDQGREVLTYFTGTVGHPPLAPHLRGDATLVAIARLLRRFHDVTIPFVDRYSDGWQYPALAPAEVICHGDFAPYNCVFQDAQPVGIIDFDTARPAPRWWDLGYVVYCLVPLAPAEQGGFGQSPEEQLRRVQLFFDSYGPVPSTTPPLLDQVVARLDNMLDLIRNHPAFVKQRAERHDDGYRRDLAYLREHADLWSTLRF
ncbi:MAG TPA: aminoglycoside phosphotransferase family protein [Pseudonocardiaceae bacterium]